MSAIGSLNEKPLHAALKEWYREEGDRVEEPLEGFVVDLVRGELLIEIQTRSFSSMRRKVDRLLDTHSLKLVHPVAAVKWIVKLDGEGRAGVAPALAQDAGSPPTCAKSSCRFRRC